MLLAELIQKLTGLLAENGNVPVVLDIDCGLKTNGRSVATADVIQAHRRVSGEWTTIIMKGEQGRNIISLT